MHELVKNGQPEDSCYVVGRFVLPRRHAWCTLLKWFSAAWQLIHRWWMHMDGSLRMPVRLGLAWAACLQGKRAACGSDSEGIAPSRLSAPGVLVAPRVRASSRGSCFALTVDIALAALIDITDIKACALLLTVE
jgi:hypothetical protein